MKINFTLLPLLISAMAFAQIPSGYYDGTSGLKGEALKTKLNQIITNGHKDKGYNSLWTAYSAGDIDKFYENDGSILDIYSENPSGADPYNFKPSDKCGNYNSESDCYNREHIIPQSSFGKKAPMVSDYLQVFPTDGKVNGMRSNYPFSEVGSASWTSRNGSKLGTSNISGYSGTAFEPLDEFKGDVARTILYFATRYENNLSGMDFEMLGKTTYPGISSWAVPMLLKWHQQDPVSERERLRNDAGYNHQGNRNPFVDYPEFVNFIWGDSTNTTPTPTPPSTPPTNGATCGTETFDNIPANASNYAVRTWTNNNISWTASDARTDQTLNGKAIVIRNGALESSTISGGIGSLSISTKLVFKGSNGSFDLLINGNKVGTIPYSATEQTTTISDINISGDIVIKITNNTSTSNRVAFDNLSWTCRKPLSVDNINTKNQALTIYPNPVKNQTFTITGIGSNETLRIFNTNGQLIQTFNNVKNGDKISLKPLEKGVYIVKVSSQSTKIIIK